MKYTVIHPTTGNSRPFRRYAEAREYAESLSRIHRVGVEIQRSPKSYDAVHLILVLR